MCCPLAVKLLHAFAPPHAVLRFLLDQHELKQNDLASEIGCQSVVSEILNGNRELMPVKLRHCLHGLGYQLPHFFDGYVNKLSTA